MYPHDFEDTINVDEQRRQQNNRVPRRHRFGMNPGFSLFISITLVALCAVVAISMPY